MASSIRASPKCHHLVIHTGNILLSENYGKLLIKSIENKGNSFDEMFDFVQYQLDERKSSSLKDSTISDEYFSTHGGDDFLKYNSIDWPFGPSSLEDQKRMDLRLVVKLFASQLQPDHIRQCIDCILNLLKNTEFIDVLILPTVQPPEYGNLDKTDEVSEWLNVMKPIWRKAEEFVDKKVVADIGVSDLEKSQLEALYQWSHVKPYNDHIHKDMCDSIPSDLREYTKSKNIRLLTHDDPQPFITDDKLTKMCIEKLNLTTDHRCLKWDTTWCARYTVTFYQRSVILAKGYLVKLEQMTK